MTRLCARCGAPIPDPTQDAKLCPDCLLAARRESVVRARICKQCGRSFPGGPRAQYCPECRAERAKQAKARYKRKGSADRPLGSTDVCARCGAEYTVEGARQRYCPQCAADAVREAVRPHKRAYNAEDPERRAAWRIAYKGSRTQCIVCGKEFIAHRSTNVCSPECREIRKKQRQSKKSNPKDQTNQEIKKEAPPMKHPIYLRYYPIHDGRSVKAYGFAVIRNEDGTTFSPYHEVDYDVWAVGPKMNGPMTWPEADAATRKRFFAFCRKEIEQVIAFDAMDLNGTPRSAFEFPITGEFIETEENAPDPDGIEC